MPLPRILRSFTPRMLTAAAFSAQLIMQETQAEEQSVLVGAEFVNEGLRTKDQNTSLTALIDGGFMSMAVSEWANEYAVNMKQFKVRLAREESIVSVFVQNCNTDHNRTSQIFIGSDMQLLSYDELTERRASWDLNDSGFYLMKTVAQCFGNNEIDYTPVSGKEVWIRRIRQNPMEVKKANPRDQTKKIKWQELRVYQTPNIVQLLQGKPQLKIDAPTPKDSNSKYAATNLIENLGNRSPYMDEHPIQEYDGKEAAWYSCYVTSKTELSQEGHQLKIQVDLGESYFQHAILLVQAIFGEYYHDQIAHEDINWLQNIRLFVGESPDYTKNAECAGGPFLVYDDPKNKVQVEYNAGENHKTDLWKYGEEVWCNKQGRYTTIVADLIRLADKDYEMSLCHLGIMGTQYERTTAIETQVSMLIDDEYTMLVQPIYAKIVIGNTLDIKLRQKSSTKLEWVSIFQENPSRVMLQPAGLYSGEFKLDLESFDAAGEVYSTLRSDQVSVKVCPIRKTNIKKAEEELLSKPILINIEDGTSYTQVASYKEVYDHLVKTVVYDSIAKQLCGDISVLLDTTEQIFSLDQANQLVRIPNKPTSSPWKSTGSRLKFSLNEHKLDWYVPIEASYTSITQQTNTAPSIIDPVSMVTVYLGSKAQQNVFKVGTPVDLEGDDIRITSWQVRQLGHFTDTSWISLVYSASITIDGIRFSFTPNETNIGQTVEISFEIEDSNTDDPKSATYQFQVSVKALCGQTSNNGKQDGPNSDTGYQSNAQTSNHEQDCEEFEDSTEQDNSSQNESNSGDANIQSSKDPKSFGSSNENNQPSDQDQEQKEAEPEQIFYPIWNKSESESQSKRQQYKDVTILEVSLVAPDELGVLALTFSDFVNVPFSALFWSSSNEGASLVDIVFYMSETTLDIIYDQDLDHNQMTWQVLDVNQKKREGKRMLQNDAKEQLIQIDSISIQLTFTEPQLVSLKKQDKIKVQVKKEIFKEHLTTVGKDELVFIDSSSFDITTKLKVPRQLTQEELEIIAMVEDVQENSMKCFIAANAILGYLSASALQYLWGLINGAQMIALTSLFDVIFPPNIKTIVQRLWSLVQFDFLNIEDKLGEIFEFRETEAFLTTYDEDGEAESRFADAGYESSNFIALAGPLFVLFIFSLLVALSRSMITLIVYKCGDDYCKKKFADKIYYLAICLRFLLEGCIEIGLSAMIAVLKVDKETFDDNLETFGFVFAVLSLLVLLIVPFLVTCFSFRYVNQQRAVLETEKGKLDFNVDDKVAEDDLKDHETTQGGELKEKFFGSFRVNKPAQAYRLVFFLRRYGVICFLLFSPARIMLQILLYLELTNATILYLMIYKPSNEGIINTKEIINEFLVLIAIYPLLIFSDWAPDNETRNAGGWFLSCIIFILILFNLTLLACSETRRLYSKTRTWCAVRKARKALLAKLNEYNVQSMFTLEQKIELTKDQVSDIQIEDYDESDSEIQESQPTSQKQKLDAPREKIDLLEQNDCDVFDPQQGQSVLEPRDVPQFSYSRQQIVLDQVSIGRKNNQQDSPFNSLGASPQLEKADRSPFHSRLLLKPTQPKDQLIVSKPKRPEEVKGKYDYLKDIFLPPQSQSSSEQSKQSKASPARNKSSANQYATRERTIRWQSEESRDLVNYRPYLGYKKNSCAISASACKGTKRHTSDILKPSRADQSAC